MNELIVNRIISTLKEKKMTAASLATALKNSPSVVTDWKRGKTKPSVEHIIKIAEFLEVSLMWLLTGKGDKYNLRPLTLDEKDEILLRHIKTLDEADQAQLSGFILAMVDYMKKRPKNLSISDLGEFGEKKKKRKVKIYDLSASAGFGNYLEDESPYTIFEFDEELIPQAADFGIRISGDSMEPRISDGTTVWVKEQIQIDDGNIGIFILNGEAFCKKLAIDHANQQVKLVSLNTQYEPIVIGEDDFLKTVGKVVFR